MSPKHAKVSTPEKKKCRLPRTRAVRQAAPRPLLGLTRFTADRSVPIQRPSAHPTCFLAALWNVSVLLRISRSLARPRALGAMTLTSRIAVCLARGQSPQQPLCDQTNGPPRKTRIISTALCSSCFFLRLHSARRVTHHICPLRKYFRLLGAMKTDDGVEESGFCDQPSRAGASAYGRSL